MKPLVIGLSDLQEDAIKVKLGSTTANGDHVVRAGQQIVVDGHENPTTGYQLMWEAQGSAAAAVKLIDSSYKLDSHLIGAGGIHTFLFEVDETANSGDSFELMWNNARSWEKPEGGFFAEPSDAVAFTIA